MLILTNDNNTFELNEIPEEIDDIRYGVLDYSDPANVDYYFLPLVFLESFSSPVVDLLIGGKYRIQMPMDWSVVIGEEDFGNIEIMSLKHVNDRGFQAFAFNPIGEGQNGYTPHFLEIEVLNYFPDIKWYFPKLKSGHILTVPLERSDNPQCVYFVKEVNKVPDALDISVLI